MNFRAPGLNFNNNNDPNTASTSKTTNSGSPATTATSREQANNPQLAVNSRNFPHLSRSTPDVSNMAASSSAAPAQGTQGIQGTLKHKISQNNHGSFNLQPPQQAGASNQVSALSFTSVASQINGSSTSGMDPGATPPASKSESNSQHTNTHTNNIGIGTQTSFLTNTINTGVQQILDEISNLSFQTPPPPANANQTQTSVPEGRVDFSVPVSQTTQTNQNAQNSFQLPAVQPSVPIYHAAEHAYEQYTTNLIRRCTLKVRAEYFQQVYDDNLVPEWTVTFLPEKNVIGSQDVAEQIVEFRHQQTREVHDLS